MPCAERPSAPQGGGAGWQRLELPGKLVDSGRGTGVFEWRRRLFAADSLGAVELRLGLSFRRSGTFTCGERGRRLHQGFWAHPALRSRTAPHRDARGTLGEVEVG